MWSEACEMLMRAERMHRQLFQPQGGTYRAAAWEPPADMLETDSHIVIYVALPGVDQEHVELAIDGGELVIAGARILPAELQMRCHSSLGIAAGPLHAPNSAAARPL